jgi:hypothetical protein
MAGYSYSSDKKSRLPPTIKVNSSVKIYPPSVGISNSEQRLYVITG